MKHLFFSITILFSLFSTVTVWAQEEQPSSSIKKEKKEIIINSNGDEEQRIVVQVDGDGVTINGKPYKPEDGKSNVIIKKFRIDDMDNDNDEVYNNTAETTDSIAFLGVMTKSADDKGAEITDITENTAAEKAGLQVGDIITRLGNQKVEDPSSLADAVKSYHPKDEVDIVFLRNGKEKKTKATLQLKKVIKRKKIFLMQSGTPFSKPTPKDPTAKPKLDEFDINVDIPELLGEGFALDGKDLNFNFNGNKKEKLGLKLQDTDGEKGVKVLDVVENSAAAKSGLQKDDVIIAIDGEKTTNTDEARVQLKMQDDKNKYSIKAKRNGAVMNFEISKPKRLKTIDL